MIPSALLRAGVRRCVLVVVCGVLVACRTTSTTPITSFDAHAAERSLIRVRATSSDKTQSFRALLQYSPGAMLLTGYTPLGTSAFRLFAAGDRVVFLNDAENTTWSGTPAEFASSFGFFGDTTPVAMAELILGRRGVEATQIGDVTIAYDPASFPPKRVTVARGGQRLEIEHLESVYTTASVDEPKVPRGYRCCVPPRL